MSAAAKKQSHTMSVSWAHTHTHTHRFEWDLKNIPLKEVIVELPACWI
jgi:hypothetical protein